MGANGKMCCQSVIAKEDQGKAVLSIYIAAKEVLPAFNNTKCISFKSGCVLRVTKHLKGDWFTFA